jgi:hypothetical protein
MPLGMIDGSLVAQLCWAELKGTVSLNEAAHEHGVRMFVKHISVRALLACHPRAISVIEKHGSIKMGCQAKIAFRPTSTIILAL